MVNYCIFICKAIKKPSIYSILFLKIYKYSVTKWPSGKDSNFTLAGRRSDPVSMTVINMVNKFSPKFVTIFMKKSKKSKKPFQFLYDIGIYSLWFNLVCFT